MKKTVILGYWDSKGLVVSKNLCIFAARLFKRLKMIQTHLMKLDAPYPVLNMKGVLARHVATLIEIHPAVDPKTGEETIKTISRPVVDYGENCYAGIVYEKFELEDCEILDSPLPMHQLRARRLHRIAAQAIACSICPTRLPTRMPRICLRSLVVITPTPTSCCGRARSENS